MIRYRITAKSPGHSYTISLVRFLNDEQARKLAKSSIGKARSMVPVDIQELVTYREEFAPNGMTTARTEIGRCPA